MGLDPRTAAVIAVHLEQDIVGSQGAMAGFFQEQIVARDIFGAVNRLLVAARSSGALIVLTRVAWAPDYSDLHANSPLLTMTIQSRSLVEGEPGTEIVPEIGPTHGAEIVTHKRVGGFSDSRLHELLQARGITTVIFAGVATNVSVEGTARQASDLGYRTIVVEDACSAATPEAHQASIASLALLAEIASVTEIEGGLTRT